MIWSAEKEETITAVAFFRLIGVSIGLLRNARSEGGEEDRYIGIKR